MRIETVNLLRKAKELVWLHRYADAEGMLRVVLAEVPDMSLPYALLGESLANMGRAREGLAATETAIGLHPQLGYIFVAHSICLNACGRRPDAIDALCEALRIEPNNASYMQKLAHQYYHEKRLDDCLALLDRALALAPNMAACFTLQGTAFFQLGREKEAVRSFERAIEVDPENAQAHGMLGIIRSHHGQNDSAIEHLMEARRLNPAGPDARDRIAKAMRDELGVVRWIRRVAPPWTQAPPKIANLYFGGFVAVYSYLVFVQPAKQPWPMELWGALLMNWLCMPLTFEPLATAISNLVHRRTIGFSRASQLRILPLTLCVLLIHIAATAIGIWSQNIAAGAIVGAWLRNRACANAPEEGQLPRLIRISSRIALFSFLVFLNSRLFALELRHILDALGAVVAVAFLTDPTIALIERVEPKYR